MAEFFLTLGMSFVLALLPIGLILMPLGALIDAMGSAGQTRVVELISAIITWAALITSVVIFVKGMLTLV